ncbi:hypothetical protein BJ875DRAFT_256374 [Amylocarpus encephaloides]|uniref:FAD synthase n=1 Tax=Amylocarpus encephaloides TaxID=45428 RepID=A0A9P7YLN0_9HELO|nr:hypothetical protein BJ875DRAFT_256374 [Amylocarpus encephaloides]
MPEATDDNAPIIPNGNDNTSTTIAPICAEVAAKVNAFLESEPESPLLRRVQEQTRIALGVIGEALERYSLEELSLSYNGGKDCLVLLILLLSALHTHSTKSPSPITLPSRLQSVYIISSHPFPEVTSFVTSTTATYTLDLAHYAKPMKAAFAQYLEEKPRVRAILVGTRRTDPHGGFLTHFDRTDHGWPGFMRVHPVIDWHYTDIWGFIRHLQIPYCTLYDQGYTSLGGTTDTHPNPALKASHATQADHTEEQGFRPAYELVEDNEERLGRDR